MIERKRKGFTLIELLVVIAILGVLAVGLITIIDPVGQLTKTRNTIIQTHFSSMRNEVDAARITYGKPLGEITGSWWSEGSCQPPVKATDAVCVNKMNTSWQKVTGKNMPKDPWGNPYLLNENELEGGVCSPDGLKSVGPDHISGGGDDTVYQIPTAFC